MTGEFIVILFSCTFLSPVIAGYVLNENPNNSNYEEGERNKIFLKLYEQCMKMDTEACVSYKLLCTSWSYLQNTTFLQSDDVTESGAGRQEMEEKVDDILLQKFIQSVTSSSLWSSSSTAHMARRALRLKKKMLFPILIGLALKFVSLVPIVLAKLVFIGSMAILASKISLVLTGIFGLRKLFSGADGGLSQQGQLYHDGHYVYYGGDGQHPQQRMTYVYRGRQIGDQEEWTPLVVDGSRSLVSDSDKGGFINQNAVKGIKRQGYFAQSLRDEGSNNVRGVMYRTTNGSKIYGGSNYRQTKSVKSREDAGTSAVESERKISYETDKNRANLFNQKRQIQYLDMKIKHDDINLAQSALNPNSKSHGDTGSVTHHGAIYTRDSAETRVESHVTDERYEQSKESVSGGQNEFEVRYKEEKVPQNKAKRLVKGYYEDETYGQNHNRNYSSGRRHLDMVDSEHLDALLLSRKVNRA